jgi:uncharacterized protein YbjQ (UPF0145 family)
MFTSCATYLPAPKSFVGVIDYSVLTSKGLFVTESNSVNFDYRAIGSVIAEEIGGWIPKNSAQSSVNVNDEYYVGSSTKKVYKNPDVQVAFDNIAEQLSSIGANGIINLKITTSSEMDLVSKFSVDKITVSGMAIRK